MQASAHIRHATCLESRALTRSKAAMSVAREKMEKELGQLQKQREQYNLAASATEDNAQTERRKKAVARLDAEIEALTASLVALDDHTTPVVLN